MHGISSSDLIKLDCWLHTPGADWPELRSAEEKEEEEDQMLTVAYDQLMCDEGDCVCFAPLRGPTRKSSKLNGNEECLMGINLTPPPPPRPPPVVQAFHLSRDNIGPQHDMKLCSQTPPLPSAGGLLGGI